MTERVNLVDAYDNRSVVAKLVSMEERISGAETSVEASAEAAASSASKAAASQTAAKTSEANAKASADAAAATLSNTVDLSSKQTITGAKTFAGDTTVTGQLISSGTNTLSGTTELEGTVELDSTAVATLNGKVTASNTGNSIKVANHDTVLTSNDVLSAKDINTPNGDANNLIHRSGDEAVTGLKIFDTLVGTPLRGRVTKANTAMELGRVKRTSNFVNTQLKIFAQLCTRSGVFFGQILVNIDSTGAITTGGKNGVGVSDASSMLYVYDGEDNTVIVAVGNKNTAYNNYLSGEIKGATVGPGIVADVDFTSAGTQITPSSTALQIDLTM